MPAKTISLALFASLLTGCPIDQFVSEGFGDPSGNSSDVTTTDTSGDGDGDTGWPDCDDADKLCDHEFSLPDMSYQSVDVIGDFALDGWTTGVPLTLDGTTLARRYEQLLEHHRPVQVSHRRRHQLHPGSKQPQHRRRRLRRRQLGARSGHLRHVERLLGRRVLALQSSCVSQRGVSGMLEERFAAHDLAASGLPNRRVGSSQSHVGRLHDVSTNSLGLSGTPRPPRRSTSPRNPANSLAYRKTAAVVGLRWVG